MPEILGEVLIHGLIDTRSIRCRATARGRRELLFHLNRWRVPNESAVHPRCVVRFRVHYREVAKTLRALASRHLGVSRLLVRVETDHVDILHLGQSCIDDALRADAPAPGAPRLLVDDVLGLVEIDAAEGAYKCLLTQDDGTKLRVAIVASGIPLAELTLARARAAAAQIPKLDPVAPARGGERAAPRAVRLFVGADGVDHWSCADGRDDAAAPVPCLIPR